MIRLILLSIIAGVFYAAGFPILGSTYYCFPAPIIAFYIFGRIIYQNKSLKKQIVAWAFFSIGFYLLGFNWIPYTLYEFGNVEAPLNQIIGFLSFTVLLPPVLIFILAIKLSNKYLSAEWIEHLKKPLNISIIATITLENLPSQFPAFPGHSWLFLTPYLGLGSIFGSSIYTFFSFFLSTQFIFNKPSKKFILKVAAQISFFLFLNLLLTYIQNNFEYQKEKVNIRVVQANIGNDSKTASEKGDIKSVYEIFSTYYDLSLKTSQTPFDLIIWPETAFPYNINTNSIRKNIYNVPNLVEEILNLSNSNLFFGVRDAPKEDTLYNSGMFIKSDFQFDIYYKNKLLPFGEDLPLGPLTPYAKPYFRSIAFFDKGYKTKVFKLKDQISFSSMICYEVLFPNLIFNQLRIEKDFPSFFVNITNDSWYGNTSEPEQHLFLSRWRAIEFGIPLIRSTNTGISTIIRPNGNYGRRLEYNVEGVLDEEIEIRKDYRSFFSKTGSYFFIFIGLFTVFVGYSLRKRKALF